MGMILATILLLYPVSYIALRCTQLDFSATRSATAGHIRIMCWVYWRNGPGGASRVLDGFYRPLVICEGFMFPPLVFE